MYDMNGSPLKEGDQVFVPLGFGQTMIGQVVAVGSGIVTPGAPMAPPTVTIAIQIALFPQPNGVVMGLVKVGAPTQPPQEG